MVTLIGVYDNFEAARFAHSAVLGTGLPWTQVQLNPDHEVQHEARSATPHTDDPSVSAGIGTFFRSLFGVGDKSTHSNVYAEAVRHGDYVVTVDVDTDAQCTQVEQILRTHQPVNLEQRSADWMQHGWRGHDPGQGGKEPRR